jgi:hypothetical protein
MISQHSQTATLTVEVSQEQSTEGMLVEAIARGSIPLLQKYHTAN